LLTTQRERVLVIARDPVLAATFSAVSGWIDAEAGFQHRIDEAPGRWSVFDRASRENGLSALPRTNGARVMLSTPPATVSCASLVRMGAARRD